MEDSISRPECSYEEIYENSPEEILCTEGKDGKNELYVGTQSGLYCSIDNGGNWQELCSGRTMRNVRRIALGKNAVYAAADGGVYACSQKKACEFLADVSDIEGVVVLEGENEGDTVFLWNKNEIFRINDGRVIDITSGGIESPIRDVVSGENRLFVFAGRTLLKLSSEGKVLDSVFLTDSSPEDPEEMIQSGDIEAVPEGEEEQKRAITGRLLSYGKVSGKGKVAAVAPTGILVHNAEGGTPVIIGTTGLPSTEVRQVVFSGDQLAVATERKVFLYIEDERSWRTIFESDRPSGIGFISAYSGENGARSILVVSGETLFKVGADPKIQDSDFLSSDGAGYVQRIEPSVREVQVMAIEYAEVSPDKIAKWRQGARWKAIMPKLSVGFGESTDDNGEIYTSATKCFYMEGPRKCGEDWNVDLAWDFSDLVWNDAQTSIDTRSKLMVELRDRILEEVTRLYFERKRLMLDIGRPDGNEKQRETNSIAKAEKMLKVDELTAHIDALTGGKFSESMK